MLPYLLADFTQVRAMAPLGRHSQASTAGACHNFTLDWISAMFADAGAAGQSEAKERMRKLGLRAGAGNPVLQSVFGRKWESDGHRDADRMMIALRGLKEVALAIDYRKFDLSGLIGNIAQPQAEGMVYSFWFKGSVPGAAGGAHTIGFYQQLAAGGGQLRHQSDGLSCFDPNFGECYVGWNVFPNWFDQLQASYGPFQNHMLKAVTKSA
jgi:hypothetical protein